VNFEINQF